MKAVFSRVVAVAALAVATALPARADVPSLASYSIMSRTFMVYSGMSSFDVQFLFGRGGNTSTLFYTVGNSITAGSTWTSILSTNNPATTLFPQQITNPAPGTVFSGLSLGSIVGPTEVRFAICEGAFSGTTSNLAGTCANVSSNGPFTTGPVAPNVRVLSTTEWNGTVQPSIAPEGAQANADMNTVFGFEDLGPQISDFDYNDVVFATTLQVPEPASFALLAAGLASMAMVARRRRNTIA